MAVRAAEGLPAAGQQGAVQGQGPQPAGPGGQDVFPAGTKTGTAPAKPAPLGPTAQRLTRALSGTTGARGQGKDLCPPGASAARGRLRDQPDGAR